MSTPTDPPAVYYVNLNISATLSSGGSNLNVNKGLTVAVPDMKTLGQLIIDVETFMENWTPVQPSV